MQRSSSSCAEPLKCFLGTVQTPEKGSFDFTALQWTDKVIIKGKNQGNFDQDAYIRTDTVQDFIHGVCGLPQLLICFLDQVAGVKYQLICAGEELRASTSFYHSKVWASQLPSDRKRLQADSYLQQRTLHCGYGREDNSKAVPVSLMQPARAANQNCGKTERRKSCKRGCLMQFTITQLAIWPDITHIVGRHFNHINAAVLDAV